MPRTKPVRKPRQGSADESAEPRLSVTIDDLTKHTLTIIDKTQKGQADAIASMNCTVESFAQTLGVSNTAITQLIGEKIELSCELAREKQKSLDRDSKLAELEVQLAQIKATAETERRKWSTMLTLGAGIAKASGITLPGMALPASEPSAGEGQAKPLARRMADAFESTIESLSEETRAGLIKDLSEEQFATLIALISEAKDTSGP